MSKTDELMELLAQWQEIETDIIEYTKSELRKAQPPLIRTMLRVLEFEAQKHGVVQQMIAEGVKLEAVNLSPDELKALSECLDRRLANEEKTISIMEDALNKTETLIPRYLLAYLIADLKIQNRLLRQFDDELKTASIPTSITSKTFDFFKA